MNQLKEDHYYNYIIIIFRLKNKFPKTKLH